MAFASGQRSALRLLPFVVLTTAGCFVPDRKEPVQQPPTNPDAEVVDPDAQGPSVGRVCPSGRYDLDGDGQCEYACAQKFRGADEVCGDKEDNDCDGLKDEGCDCQPGDDIECPRAGVCRAIQACVAGRRGACVEVVKAASAETCDGQDNDCDGETDEGFHTASNVDHCGACGNRCAPPNATPVCEDGQCKMGACGAGFVDLDNDPRTGCEYKCTKAPGVSDDSNCNKLDDDCDGRVDEDCGCAVTAAERVVCGVNAGTCQSSMSCQAGKWGDCETTGKSDERCDGQDNDCDGQTDEDFRLDTDALNCGTCGNRCSFPNAGSACTGGQCRLDACQTGYRDLDGLAANGCEYKCSASAMAGGETCGNHEDDNCDGKVDEGCVCEPNGAEIACGENRGACKAHMTCAAGKLTECQVIVKPSPEVCDGVDNDCDDGIDEDFDLLTDAANCGACKRACFFANAQPRCSAGQCELLRCDAGYIDLDRSPANGCEYRCTATASGDQCGNRRDDNCDGRVDEGCRCDPADQTPVLCGNNLGTCKSATTCTTDGQFGACLVAVPPSPEQCDGLDNDCDDGIDEDFDLDRDPRNCGGCNRTCLFANAEAACSSGRCVRGACRSGFVDLDGLADTGCEYRCTPTGDEACGNRQDDDCDGEVDEGCSCDPGNTQPVVCGNNQGVCRSTTSCTPQGQFAPCAAVVGPGPETCDGQDNDCDGRVDDGFDLQSDAANCGRCGQQCFFANGVPVCLGGQCQLRSCRAGFLDLDEDPGNGCEYHCTATAAVERCGNRLDDNCDGRVDEGCECDPDDIARVQCGNNRGLCKASMACGADARYQGCFVSVGPTAERCDGLDNDCDGQVDDGFDLQTDRLHCGACGQLCSFSNATSACVAGQCALGACAPGFVNLDRMADNGCEYKCTPVASGTETCGNKRDDDCDGEVDEGCRCDPNDPTPIVCGNNQGRCHSSATCRADGLSYGPCLTSVGPRIEDCNGVDDDCDGSIDESFDLRTDPLNCSTCGFRCTFANAESSCRSGECELTRCSVGFVNHDGLSSNGCEYKCPVMPPVTERCGNRLDDDCDGLVDEDCDCDPNLELPVLCGNNSGVCKGTMLCLASGRWGSCRRIVNPSAERCDGFDNDCDGSVDEDFDLTSDPAHCGSCGNRCSFANATATCAMGACAFGACLAGHADLDRVPDNGCEYRCPVVPVLAAERCGNRLDDNCDGRVDEGCPTDGSCDEQGCRCRIQPANVSRFTMDGGSHASAVSCQLQEQGTLDMTYQIRCERFPDGQYPWAQCIAELPMATSFDLNQFDGDNLGQGYLEVRFCVDSVDEATVQGGLNLWYGAYPRRKFLRLLQGREAAASSRVCFVRRFSPEDAECGHFDKDTIDATVRASIPEVCRLNPGEGDGWHCRGRWRDRGEACGFDYKNTPLWITAESCTSDVHARVTDLSIRYFSGACRCDDSEDCRESARPACVSAGEGSCDERRFYCAGTCQPATSNCAGAGNRCEVRPRAGTVCQSNVTCLDGQPVCPIAGCRSEGLD